MKFVGSICLSDIPKSEMKKIMCKDGKERYFVNISIHENKEPRYAERNGKQVLVSDHIISCAPKKEERVDGVNYLIGNLRTWTEQYIPTTGEIDEAPASNDSLPFL